jgi:hypothetical protein
MSSKHNQLKAGLANRTKEPEPEGVANSAYNEGFSLGPDFVEDLEPVNPELIAEKERLEQELAHVSERAIVRHDDGTMVMGGVRITKIGLYIPDNLEQDDWAYLGEYLFGIEAVLQWSVGDWLVYGENHHYGDVESIANSLRKSRGTLYNWTWVSKLLPKESDIDDDGNEISYRYENLSHTHHQTALSLLGTKEKCAKWLKKASQGDGGERWSISRLRREILDSGEAREAINQPKTTKSVASHTKKMQGLAELLLNDNKISGKKRQKFLDDIKSLRDVLNQLEEKLNTQPVEAK